MLCGQMVVQTLAGWTEGWTDFCCVDRGLDRLLLAGWTEGWTGSCWLGRQRVGQALAGWVDRGLDRLLLAGWTEGWTGSCWLGGQRVRQALAIQCWTGSFCVDRVGQTLDVWTGLDRLFLCGQC